MALTHENDQLYVVNPTNEPFTVHWGKNPITLQPGEQATLHRFIAQHFAKHLADKILLQKEADHKAKYMAQPGASAKDYQPKNYLNSRTERPKVVATIITGVYRYFTAQGSAYDPNAAEQARIQQMLENQPGGQQPQPQQDKAMNLGSITTDPVLGALEDDDEDEQPQVPAQMAQPVQPTTAPQTPYPGQPMGQQVPPAPPIPAPGPQYPPQQPQPQQPPYPPVTPTPPPATHPDPNAPLPGQLAIPTQPETPQQQPGQPQQPQPQEQPQAAPSGPTGSARLDKMDRSQLFAEAKKLGLKLPGNTSNADLKSAIMNF